MKNILLVICLFIGSINTHSQSIDEALQSGDLDNLKQVEAKVNGDLQTQIDYLKELVYSLTNELKQLKISLEKKDTKSNLLLEFETFLDKSDSYIASNFYKKELKEIAKELDLTISGTKLTLIKRIKESLKIK